MTKNEIMKLVGENLRHYRLESGLTQEELAERAGISTSFCANLERGKKGMSLLVLRELAHSLNISVDYLLSDDREKDHIRNIEVLLNGKPESFIISIEKLVRLCADEFGEREKRNETGNKG